MAHQEAAEEMRGWELGVTVIGGSMVEAGFEGIGKFITRRQNTAVQYIVTRPILDLCVRSAQMLGTRLSWRWW